jgi:DASS family divalent anion:Na+ symporter
VAVGTAGQPIPSARGIPSTALRWLGSRTSRVCALVTIYAVITLAFPRPEAVTPAGWRITAIFLTTVAGLLLQPVPGAAMVLIGLTLLVLVGGLPTTEALSGFGSPSVWLVLAAMLMARVLRETGVARRVALIFIRMFGARSIGVAYALVFTDVTLAGGIPSITARSGGIVLPVARSIAELYESHPGPSAERLGRFLMTALYQGSAVACAMFMTGQAGNVLAVTLAQKAAGVSITWASWFLAGLAPGLMSAIVVPLVVYRLVPPTLTHTPLAAEFAREELQRMGPLRRAERIALVVFLGVCGLWLTSQWHGLDVTIVALAGIGILFVTNILTWDSALAERPAWDIFVWYGGLVTLGDVLNRTGSPAAFAGAVGGWFAGVPWFTALIVTLMIYFYVHYALASITAHVLALFPPFLAMLIGIGTPPLLAVYSLACIVNLTAGLTHYGTTTAPIVFAERYVTMGEWWRVGLLVSFVNIAIWLTIGFAWWRFLGFW